MDDKNKSTINSINAPRYDGGPYTTIAIVLIAIILIIAMILGLVFLNVGVTPDREICNTVYGLIHPNCFGVQGDGQGCYIGYNCSRWTLFGRVTCCNGVCMEKSSPFSPCPI